MEQYQQIERSIIKKFRREIWSPFITGVNRYELLHENDKIAVCISGGKDSMLLAKCMQEIQHHGNFHFDLEFLVMDPGYLPANRQVIIDNARLLNIPIRIFDSQIYDIVAGIHESPCYLCARMRRGHLYSYARELGCNKIALGHHFDDVIETILMSMLYGAQMRTMMPKLHSKNFEGMQLIRPLYMVKEASILAWKNYNNLQFIQCACRFTDDCTLDNPGKKKTSKRREMKELIATLRTVSDHIDINIFQSVHNVNLETLIGYRWGEERRSFLDHYSDAGKYSPFAAGEE